MVTIQYNISSKLLRNNFLLAYLCWAIVLRRGLNGSVLLLLQGIPYATGQHDSQLLESRTLQANMARNFPSFIRECFLSFPMFKWFSQFYGVLNLLCQILHSSLFNRGEFEPSELLFMAIAHKKLFESSAHIKKASLVLRFGIFGE